MGEVCPNNSRPYSLVALAEIRRASQEGCAILMLCSRWASKWPSWACGLTSAIILPFLINSSLSKLIRPHNLTFYFNFLAGLQVNGCSYLLTLDIELEEWSVADKRPLFKFNVEEI